MSDLGGTSFQVAGSAGLLGGLTVAVVHDWLTVYGGAERVLEEILAALPQADVFALVDFLPKPDRMFLEHHKIRTSFIQSLPGARRRYRDYLFLMPFAIEQFDVTGYDLVVSSSYALAKGVITGPDQIHICMCYSPMRYAWDLQFQYLRQTGLTKGLKAALVKWLLHRIRLWDALSANRVDHFIAISHFIQRRILKTYRRKSSVIYPPVDLAGFTPVEVKDDFYVTASRLVPYKRVDLIAAAFSTLPDKKLLVIGDGPEFAKIKASAPKNVELLGHVSSVTLARLLQTAKAFIFAAEEDFGIAPIEAQASGTPVIAYAKGGALETLGGNDGSPRAGVFFYEQSTEALREAISRFESQPRIPAAYCRANAERFSKVRFQEEFRKYLVDHAFRKGGTQPGLL